MALNDRQAARLAWLKKNRPNDPQIAKLQKMGGAPTSPDGSNDPGTTGLGNTATTVDNFLEGVFQNMQPLDLNGAPKVLGDQDLMGARKSAYDALYTQGTQNLERNKMRDLEAQKQELANRGIPYDPANPESGYGKAIGAVNERYDQLYKDADVAANLGADSRLATLAGVNKTASDSFLQGAIAKYQSQLDAASTSGSILQDLMTKYGIDQQTAQAALERKLRLKIANMQNVQSGGGGSSADTTSPIIGGNAPGW